MNKALVSFLKIGKAVAESLVPQIAIVESAVTNLKSGGDKKQNVLDILNASPAIIEAVAGKEIMDEALFAEGVSQVNDGLVKIMKATGAKP